MTSPSNFTERQDRPEFTQAVAIRGDEGGANIPRPRSIRGTEQRLTVGDMLYFPAITPHQHKLIVKVESTKLPKERCASPWIHRSSSGL